MAFILLSIWVQLGSFFFLLSGLIGDLLLIRLFLYLAYVMLLANALLGSPLWPKILSVDKITFSEVAMDSFVWSVLSLYVHGSSLVALIWDERAPKLTEDEAALWRMMYRSGGLSARLFQDIVAKHLDVVEVEAGDVIDTENYFFIIYRGRIELEVFEGEQRSHSRVLSSGEMFDPKDLGLVRTESIFDKSSVRCTALRASKLFQIRKDDLVKIARNPLSKSVFQALLINNLMYMVESYQERIPQARQDDDNYCNKIFDPLEEWEVPDPHRSGSGKALQRPLRHIWNGIRGSFGLPWPFSRQPVGLRQTQLPPPLRRDEYQKPAHQRKADIFQHRSASKPKVTRVESVIIMPSFRQQLILILLSWVAICHSFQCTSAPLKTASRSQATSYKNNDLLHLPHRTPYGSRATQQNCLLFGGFMDDIGNFMKRFTTKATASHILMSGGAEAEIKLEDLKAEIGNSPVKFAEAAAKYSECPSASSGGNLGEFGPGAMVKEFDEVVFSPKSEIGTVYGPVKTQFGYHLIYISERRD